MHYIRLVLEQYLKWECKINNLCKVNNVENNALALLAL